MSSMYSDNHVRVTTPPPPAPLHSMGLWSIATTTHRYCATFSFLQLVSTTVFRSRKVSILLYCCAEQFMGYNLSSIPHANPFSRQRRPVRDLILHGRIYRAPAYMFRQPRQQPCYPEQRCCCLPQAVRLPITQAGGQKKIRCTQLFLRSNWRISAHDMTSVDNKRKLRHNSNNHDTNAPKGRMHGPKTTRRISHLAHDGSAPILPP